MNKSVFPLIDVFDPPFDNAAILDARYSHSPNPILKDIATKQGRYDRLVIKNHWEAARCVAQMDRQAIEVENYIKDQLDKKFDRRAMPKVTPDALKKYQLNYPNYSCKDVDTEINKIGCVLSEGQFLFHAGKWEDLDYRSFNTIRPLSTSFCPQVALSNAAHNGKAFKDGRIDLFVLRAVNPRTNIFAFRQKGRSLMKHEKELLFGSGAYLRLEEEPRCVNEEYPVSHPLFSGEKTVPVYLLNVEIS